MMMKLTPGKMMELEKSSSEGDTGRNQSSSQLDDKDVSVNGIL